MKRSRVWPGGKHQRLVRARARVEGGAASSGVAPLLSSGPPSGSRLGPLDGDPEVDVLIELWSLGSLSAKTLHTIAKAAVKVAPRPTMSELASLSEGHCHRDLFRKLRLGMNDIPIPFMAELPLRDENTKPANLVEGRSYPSVCPGEFIADMVENHIEEFKTLLGLSPLAEFWSHVEDSGPRLVGHPLAKIKHFRDCVVPP